MATKKAPAKKATTKKMTSEKDMQQDSSMSSSINPTEQTNPFLIAIPIAIVVLGAILIYFSKGMFIVATVNGEPISKAQFAQEVEKQAGKQVLNSLVTNVLIKQEA